MQTEKLPSGIHKAIDRELRRCVWGEFGSKKPIRLVSWEILCRPKECGGRGGIGLKKASIMNKSLLANLAWRILTKEDKTWWKNC